jgi:hypothetical protein
MSIIRERVWHKSRRGEMPFFTLRTGRTIFTICTLCKRNGLKTDVVLSADGLMVSRIRLLACTVGVIIGRCVICRLPRHPKWIELPALRWQALSAAYRRLSTPHRELARITNGPAIGHADHATRPPSVTHDPAIPVQQIEKRQADFLFSTTPSASRPSLLDKEGSFWAVQRFALARIKAAMSRFSLMSESFSIYIICPAS